MLPELAPFQKKFGRLLQFQRADPSTALDKGVNLAIPFLNRRLKV
jgi:hypothetical protein